jgi:hypothetical protein
MFWVEVVLNNFLYHMPFQINQIVKVGNDYGRVCALSKKDSKEDEIMYNIWWFHNAKMSWIPVNKIKSVNEYEEKECVK